MFQLINTQSLNAVSESAKQSPRLRKNFNFHPSNDSNCHRLLNALEPGTYIQPHRHLDAEKDETMIALRGSFGILIFDEQGQVSDTFLLSASDLSAGNLGITIPHGVFHSMLALEENSVFFECKSGPYRALLPEEVASWAPAEGDPEVASYLANMSNLFAR